MRSKPHDEAMAELYRSDPFLARQVINAILMDGDSAELAIVLRQLALSVQPQLPEADNRLHKS
ncbi:transcriptional regulator [Herbaspirillum seropedicae]|uniref:transcriptional regulator n=1 Tax=Herbaspirillum seropedicae TaxID=964 RepID=UPI00111E594F|nr:transcriptional regulator [Herbaspirillum seropedicae]QDD63808.1 transcriptional regulator [Herbaspirillum seropedicae]